MTFDFCKGTHREATKKTKDTLVLKPKFNSNEKSTSIQETCLPIWLLSQSTFPIFQLFHSMYGSHISTLLFPPEAVCTPLVTCHILPPSLLSLLSLISTPASLQVQCDVHSLCKDAAGLEAWQCSNPHRPSHQSPEEKKQYKL